MTVRFTRRATDDLREILGYLDMRNPVAADRVRQAIAATVRLIADRPHIGLRNARAPALRSCLVGRYPYRVHYSVENAEVWIIHIRHSARRPFDPNRSD
ncbi:type II toxin-antitoxin system RelE/ParE family toxin [Rhodopseudomonas palustris]|uniref:Type II toxin-antitoxin system RelE/ParE family toxin n=1 Tax=Rhodopseudomonas palustris TaxID=1076 RepID=A0AAX3E217_RHOPL|nr:type II toxin-antitoxin system RelE/ParE family toxin [Rhodopseudomonas palustris]UYO40792.1 type II toxin-antitoxin system RelE/ParE family toxin [Rhodopseudomonas palustris]